MTVEGRMTLTVFLLTVGLCILGLFLYLFMGMFSDTEAFKAIDHRIAEYVKGKKPGENERIDFTINFLRSMLWQEKARGKHFITIDEETVETLIDTLKGEKEVDG